MILKMITVDINFIMAFVFIILAALCNVVMDLLKDKFKESIFKNLNEQFWNAQISWINKWVDGDKTKGRTHWLVFGVKITKPSFITDGWHLFKFFLQLSLAIAFGFLTPYFLGLPLFFVAWWIGFNPFYNNILKSQ